MHGNKEHGSSPSAPPIAFGGSSNSIRRIYATGSAKPPGRRLNATPRNHRYNSSPTSIRPSEQSTRYKPFNSSSKHPHCRTLKNTLKLNDSCKDNHSR